MTDEMKALHERSVEKTLAELTDGGSYLQIAAASLKDLLIEVFHLRWQTRVLQARNTELVMENRDLRERNNDLQADLDTWHLSRCNKVGPCRECDEAEARRKARG
jgi:cell division protein FtsB